MSQIRGSTALITGAASGIGKLLTEALLAEGLAHAILWDVNEAALNEELGRLARLGHSASGAVVDVSDRIAIERACSTLERPVDLLVNNAGVVVGRDFVGHGHEDIDRTMAVNSVGPMHLTAALLPGMLERKRGHVVNLASAAGLVSNPGMAVYCASKWAMVGWSDSLRLEMERSGSGVRVTTVMPYYIDTGMFDGVRSPIIPILKPEHVVGRIVAAIRRDRVFLRMPRFMNLVPLIKGLLPTRVFDLVAGRWFGIYGSMDTFRGRG